MKPSKKWKFAIGTTSRVPQSEDPFHYLIADFDNMDLSKVLDNITGSEWLDLVDPNNVILQRTPHGWHMYTDYQCDFEHLTALLRDMGADKSWIRIGYKRGYYFLAEKSRINFPWPVEHMVLHYGKEKT